MYIRVCFVFSIDLVLRFKEQIHILSKETIAALVGENLSGRKLSRFTMKLIKLKFQGPLT